MRPTRLLPLLPLLPLLLAACTGSADPAPRPSGLDPVAQRLAALAKTAAGMTYDATYSFTTAEDQQRGTLRLRQRPPAYRVDIVLGRSEATYLSNSTGVVSCTREAGARAFTCFLVARPGEPVPDLFDPGVQRLFRDAFEDLSAHPDRYRVRQASPSGSATPSPSPSAAGPDGECFAVERVGTPTASPGASPPPGFETGTYCFNADGLPTRFEVETGVIELARVGPAPDDAAFAPPAPPRALPSLTPSASPSPSASG